jgi:biopolymer transport protein ExbB
MQVKFARFIASCALALGALLPVVPGMAPVAQAQTAPATASAAVAAPAAKEALDNPYGIEALWKTSDVVAKTVLIMLLIMSVSSWYITIVKLLEQSKMGRQARAAAENFWSAGTIAQGAKALDDWVTMGIQRAVERIQSNTQGGLALLATVGSISPFVGLFGTVWGIYHALTAIGISGQASIDKVAGPVGEALIMTAIGLAVAVPAVLAYNWLVRRNKAVMDDVRAFSQDLHSVVLGTVNKA